MKQLGAFYRDRNIQIGTAVVCLLLLGAPVVMVILGAFQTNPFGEKEWTLAPLVEVFTEPATYQALWNTAGVTIAVVVISMAISVLFATLATRTNAPLRWLIYVIMAVLVATPPLFTAISWGLLGNRNVGLINTTLGIAGTDMAVNIESWWGLVFVSVIRAVGFQFYLLIGAFIAMDRNLEEAARVSGATPLRTFFGTQLPVLFPAIAGVGILSIIVLLESFELPQILGSPAGIYVLPTEIYAYLNDAGTLPKYGHASALAVGLMVLLVVLLIVQQRLMGRRSFTTVSGKGANRAKWDLGRWRYVAGAFTVIYGIVGVLLPLVQLVLVSLSPYVGAVGEYSWANFAFVLSDETILSSFWLTVGVASGGALLATLASGLILWIARQRNGVAARLIELSQWTPAAIPGLILALGVLWLILAVPGMGQLYSTPLVLIYALVITVLPLVGRAVGGAIVQVPRDLEEAAWVSGAPKWRAMISVVGRLILPSMLNGWFLCFVVLSGTLAVPLLLSTKSESLLSVNVFTYYSSGRPEIAAAIFVLLIVQIGAVAALVGIAQWLLTRSSARTAAGPAPSDPTTDPNPDPDPDTNPDAASEPGRGSAESQGVHA